MTKHDRILIDLCLKVLSEALDRTKASTIDTTEVRLALRCLIPFVQERWPLDQFWQGASADNEIGRFQSCNASLNGIVLQLKAKGWQAD